MVQCAATIVQGRGWYTHTQTYDAVTITHWKIQIQNPKRIHTKKLTQDITENKKKKYILDFFFLVVVLTTERRAQISKGFFFVSLKYKEKLDSRGEREREIKDRYTKQVFVLRQPLWVKHARIKNAKCCLVRPIQLSNNFVRVSRKKKWKKKEMWFSFFKKGNKIFVKVIFSF